MSYQTRTNLSLSVEYLFLSRERKSIKIIKSAIPSIHTA